MERGTGNNMKRKAIVLGGLTILLLVLLANLGFASEGGGHHVDSGKQMKDFMWRCIDFGALMAILVWALKKADVKGALKARQSGIEKALQEAVTARQTAEKKLAEYGQKLAKANEEIDAIAAAIREEGEREKARIIAEAQATAEKIKVQARQTADQEVAKARTELRAEAARLSVQIAEQTLKEKINKDDQDRLVGEYLTKVVELH